MIAFSTVAVLAAALTLPLGKVLEVPDHVVRTYPGRVVSIAQVNVVPQVSGEILEVCFENGQVAEEGAVLYRLDPVKYEAAVKNAEAKVVECKANLSYAELSYSRHKKLLDTRAVSIDAVDNALSQRDASRAALSAAEAELVSAQDDLKHCTIVSPIRGKLGSTSLTKGNYATPQSGTLVTIVKYAPIRVRFSISNRDYLDMFDGRLVRMQEDGEVTLTLADGKAYAEAGEIEYVENASDELTDTVMIYVKFPNADYRLRPGGTVGVTLAAKRGVMRPAIPATAILQDVRGPYVWVVGPGGEADRRYIARGDVQTNGLLYVEKGLKVGETLVREGGHKVRRGDRVSDVAGGGAPGGDEARKAGE